VVADTGTPIPSGRPGTENFVEFGSVSLDAGHLAFKALDSQGQQGIYTNIGGGLNVVADTSIPIPGGTGNFTGFGFGLFTGPSLSDGKVAFLGTDASFQFGIYLNTGASLKKVIAAGDTLDGKTVSSILMSPEGLDGHQLAFQIFFTDDSQGIYVAECKSGCD
jgi:hypothetical protein